MSRKAREIESILLAMLAPAPLYVTHALGVPVLVSFHLAMLAVLLRLVSGRGPELLPAGLMKGLAIAYIAFYPLDVAMVSGNAIAASTHLVLFIAVYQAMESRRTENQSQRLLTASLLFVASIATATHITIVGFVVIFAFLALRQLMDISHTSTARAVEKQAVTSPSSRAAAFYLAVMTASAVMLFPVMPRLRNPIVHGIGGSLTNASTGLSESIDFNRDRAITPDGTVVSRVGVPQRAIPFLVPIRLRGVTYDRFSRNEWRQPIRTFRRLNVSDGRAEIAKPRGFAAQLLIQQQAILGGRLLLPSGTYEIDDLPAVVEAPTRDLFTTTGARSVIGYTARVAREIVPLDEEQPPPRITNYPVTPEVAAMALQIVGGETDPARQAASIERYLATRFSYVADPSQIGHHMTVDQFLLTDRRGHCEYFAAGMVALLTSLNVPARIVGGFYGGKLNPLTGYFIIRREDAHAWVEVWNRQRWQTFDPTPASLRPGNTADGLIRVYAGAVTDSLNYFWDRYILTFGVADQVALLTTLISDAGAALASASRATTQAMHQVFAPRILGIMAGAVFLVLVLIPLFRRRSAFDLLAADLAANGVQVSAATTLGEALARLRKERPERAAALSPLVRAYESDRFSMRRERGLKAMIRRGLDQ